MNEPMAGVDVEWTAGGLQGLVQLGGLGNQLSSLVLRQALTRPEQLLPTLLHTAVTQIRTSDEWMQRPELQAAVEQPAEPSAEELQESASLAHMPDLQRSFIHLRRLLPLVPLANPSQHPHAPGGLLPAGASAFTFQPHSHALQPPSDPFQPADSEHAQQQHQQQQQQQQHQQHQHLQRLQHQLQQQHAHSLHAAAAAAAEAFLQGRSPLPHPMSGELQPSDIHHLLATGLDPSPDPLDSLMPPPHSATAPPTPMPHPAAAAAAQLPAPSPMPAHSPLLPATPGPAPHAAAPQPLPPPPHQHHSQPHFHPQSYPHSHVSFPSPLPTQLSPSTPPQPTVARRRKLYPLSISPLVVQFQLGMEPVPQPSQPQPPSSCQRPQPPLPHQFPQPPAQQLTMESSTQSSMRSASAESRQEGRVWTVPTGHDSGSWSESAPPPVTRKRKASTSALSSNDASDTASKSKARRSDPPPAAAASAQAETTRRASPARASLPPLSVPRPSPSATVPASARTDVMSPPAAYSSLVRASGLTPPTASPGATTPKAPTAYNSGAAAVAPALWSENQRLQRENADMRVVLNSHGYSALSSPGLSHLELYLLSLLSKTAKERLRREQCLGQRCQATLTQWPAEAQPSLTPLTPSSAPATPRPRTTVCLPCCHMCLCLDCMLAPTIHCPLCGATILEYVEVKNGETLPPAQIGNSGSNLATPVSVAQPQLTGRVSSSSQQQEQARGANVSADRASAAARPSDRLVAPVTPPSRKKAALPIPPTATAPAAAASAVNVDSQPATRPPLTQRRLMPQTFQLTSNSGIRVESKPSGAIVIGLESRGGERQADSGRARSTAAAASSQQGRAAASTLPSAAVSIPPVAPNKRSNKSTNDGGAARGAPSRQSQAASASAPPPPHANRSAPAIDLVTPAASPSRSSQQQMQPQMPMQAAQSREREPEDSRMQTGADLLAPPPSDAGRSPSPLHLGLPAVSQSGAEYAGEPETPFSLQRITAAAEAANLAANLR